MNILIYYHNDCDGIMSGAIAKQFYETNDFYKDSNIICKKIDYGYDFEKEYNYIKEQNIDELVILDFCFPEEYMNRFHKVVNNCLITWIDHHPIIDTLKLYDPTPEIYGLRSKDNAGCVLTWRYFHRDEEVPKSVLMIEDLDLWKWEIGGTKPFINYFDMMCKTPEDVLEYFELNNLEDIDIIYEFINLGNTLLKAQDNRVKKSFEKGKDIMFNGYKTRSINSNSDTSQIGEYCYKEKGYDIGLIWQVVGSKIIVGLRSNSEIEQKINVGEIAKSYGGGGHFHASGFILPITWDNLNLLINGEKSN